MDIEVSLRELLVLENPGVRFTDEVMARVRTAPAGLPRDGVARLADAHARKRSRGIVLGLLLVVGAVAAMQMWMTHGRGNPGPVQQAARANDGLSATDPVSLQEQVQARTEASGDARDPVECVDQDVLQGLLLQLPNQTLRMSAVTPPQLADFKPPRQLTFFGLTDRATGAMAQSSLVYRSTLTPDAAATVAAGVLAAAGWKLHAGLMPPADNVFTAVTMASRSGDTYCREGKPLNVAASALDGVTYVVLSVSRNSAVASSVSNACDQPVQLAARSASALDKYMPKLELPRDPATGQPPRPQGGSGGNGDVERSMTVSFFSTDAVGSVASHFARQMAEQGWGADGSWSGAGTAGSVWIRAGDDDKVLHGTLMVSAFDAGRFTAAFHVVTTR